MSSNATNAKAKELIRTSTELLIKQFEKAGGKVNVLPAQRKLKRR